MSRLDRPLVCVYLAVVLAPLAAMWLEVEDAPIHGAMEAPSRPRITFASFRRERYQQRLTRWFEAKLGLKGYAMRIDNSILFHGFGETKPGAPVRLGSDDVLFLHEDINYFSKAAPNLPEPRDVAAITDQIARAQVALARRGKALVPVIVPSKTSIYREAVPRAWSHELAEPRPTDVAVYDAFRRALDARGVRYVDARALLTSAGVRRDLVWGRHARHWSSYGACIVNREVLARRAELVGRASEHACEYELSRELPPWNADRDLATLINAWGVPPPREPSAIVVPATAPPPGAPVRTLVIGTSFGWPLVHDLVRSQTGPVHFNYYNATLVGPMVPDFAASPSVKIDPGTPAWRAATLDKDLYILDLFETYLGGPSYVTEFLTQLEGAGW